MEIEIIQGLQNEIKNWKAIAFYLADCHAATATYDGRLSSCSKARRERLNAICDAAAKMLKNGCLVGVRQYGSGAESEQRIINRCENAAKDSV